MVKKTRSRKLSKNRMKRSRKLSKNRMKRSRKLSKNRIKRSRKLSKKVKGGAPRHSIGPTAPRHSIGPTAVQKAPLPGGTPSFAPTYPNDENQEEQEKQQRRAAERDEDAIERKTERRNSPEIQNKWDGRRTEIGMPAAHWLLNKPCDACKGNRYTIRTTTLTTRRTKTATDAREEIFNPFKGSNARVDRKIERAKMLGSRAPLAAYQKGRALVGATAGKIVKNVANVATLGTHVGGITGTTYNIVECSQCGLSFWIRGNLNNFLNATGYAKERVNPKTYIDQYEMRQRQVERDERDEVEKAASIVDLAREKGKQDRAPADIQAQANTQAHAQEKQLPLAADALPEGWEFVVDQDGNYYINSKTGQSQWSRPTAPTAASWVNTVSSPYEPLHGPPKFTLPHPWAQSQEGAAATAEAYAQKHGPDHMKLLNVNKNKTSGKNAW